MKYKYFTGSFENLTEVRQFYYKLALQWHPDKGGDTATMQNINNEYEDLTRAVLNGAFYEKYSQAGRDYEQSVSDDLRQTVDKVVLLHLTGCFLEVCGNWLWLTGATKPVKDQIKEIGFKFSRNKLAWYWHPPGYRKRSKRKFDLDEIRDMWGSQAVSTEEKEPAPAIA